MSKLLTIILRFFPLGRSTMATVNQTRTDDGEISHRPDRCWEEALLAAMDDANARMYLDQYGSCYYGSRRYG